VSNDVVIGVRFREDGSAVFEKLGTAAKGAGDKASASWKQFGTEVRKLSPALGGLVSSFSGTLGALGFAAASVGKLWQVASDAVVHHFEKGIKVQGMLAEAATKAANESATAWAKSYERAAGTMEKYADVSSVFVAKGGNETLAKALAQAEGLNLQSVMRAMIGGKDLELTDDQIAEAIKAGGLAQRTGRGSLEEVTTRAMQYIKATGTTRGVETSAQLAARSAGFDTSTKLTPEELTLAKKRFEAQQDQVEEEYNRLVADRRIVDSRGMVIEGIKYQRRQFHPGMAKSMLYDEARKAAWDAAEKAKEDASYMEQGGMEVGPDGRSVYRARGIRGYTARPFMGADPDAVARQMEEENRRLGVSVRGRALRRFAGERATTEVARFEEGMNRGAEGATRERMDTVADIQTPGAREHLRAVRELQDQMAVKRAEMEELRKSPIYGTVSLARPNKQREIDELQEKISATIAGGEKAGFYRFQNQTAWINSQVGLSQAATRGGVGGTAGTVAAEVQKQEMQTRAMEAAAKVLEEARLLEEQNAKRLDEYGKRTVAPMEEDWSAESRYMRPATPFPMAPQPAAP
jgi:hypothetical protein